MPSGTSPTDCASTFSGGDHADVLTTTYKELATCRLARPGKNRPLVTKFIFQDQEFKAFFQQIPLRIVNGIFNLEVLEP